jgi:hypothetical protein
LKLTWQNLWRSMQRTLWLPACNLRLEEPVERAITTLPIMIKPKLSTALVNAPYLNEYEVIRKIASSLLVGPTLEVKNHISVFALPILDFYRRLLALPNACLISPFAASKPPDSKQLGCDYVD